MAFTKALYYPQINIPDEEWLKNAILYWDQIQTIVPESISEPYKYGVENKLYDEGLLQPLYVNSDLVEELTDDVLKYLEPPENLEAIMNEMLAEWNSYGFQRDVHEQAREVQWSHIHSEKFPFQMRQLFKSPYPEWVPVDEQFADFYMTRLAIYLSEKSGVGLLTDKVMNNKISTVLRTNTVSNSSKTKKDRGNKLSNHGDYVSSFLTQGMLASLTIERINIDPHTPIEDILRFKRNHEDELGHFRTEIGKLTSAISEDKPLGNICQQVEDIYINELKPAISSLEEELKDSRIRYLTQNFLNLTFFSTSGTLALLGFSAPQTLLAGAGISLKVSDILYNRDKKKKLRENPYSYVLEAKKAFF